MGAVIIEALLDPRFFFLRGFRLSTGEVFTTTEFFQHCTEAQGTYYTEILAPITTALGLSNLSFKKSGDYKVKIGGITIISLNKWALNLKADQESVDKIDKITGFRGVDVTPGMGTVREYSVVTRTQKVEQLLMGEVLCSYTDDTELERTGIPAYRSGLLSLAATPKKHYKKVKSYDIVSAYPAACLTYAYPTGPSTEVVVNEAFGVDRNGIVRCGKWSTEGLGYIGKFRATGIRRKSWVKLCSVQWNDTFADQYEGAEFDSLGLVGGELLFNASTPEMKLFQLQYDYDTLEVEELYTHKLEKLPVATQSLIRHWYTAKKNGGLIEKLKLNSLMGCWGRSPLKFPNIPVTDEASAERALSIYNGSDEKRPSSLGVIRTWDFRWAVYAVSYVRLTLGKIEKALAERGCEVLYSDTDSIKFIGDEGEVFNGYNEMIRSVVRQGDLGIFKDESDEYSDGVIFYAKRSYLRSSGGVLHPCLAGVNKSFAAEQLKGMKIRKLSGKSLEILTPLWIVTELPDDRLGMKFLPQKAYGRLVIGR